MSEPCAFYLLNDDYRFIDMAINVARKLLKRTIKNSNTIISYTDVVGLKKVLKGFESLPAPPDTDESGLFGLLLTEDTSIDGKSGYIRFIVMYDRFGVSIGNDGSYDAFVKDANPICKWITSSDSFRKRECSIELIENVIDEFLYQGAEIVVPDIPLDNGFWMFGKFYDNSEWWKL